MGNCANCGAELDPGWKFCISCGHAVETQHEPIPSAIRPPAVSGDDAVPRKRVDVALLVGIVMAVGGGVLIILVAVALFSSRG
ncbi:MAG: zinc ribbon domain-containing protein [Actinomycetota bacterium]